MLELVPGTHGTPGITGGTTETATYPVEVRLTGGLLALNRLVMTLHSKRMPLAGLTVARDGRGNEEGSLRATLLFDCPPESARRYATLLSGMEDIEEAEMASGTVEVALLQTNGDAWRAAAGEAGVEAHEADGLVIAAGETEMMEAWLSGLGEDVRDSVRLGPVARPGRGD